MRMRSNRSSDNTAIYDSLVVWAQWIALVGREKPARWHGKVFLVARKGWPVESKLFAMKRNAYGIITFKRRVSRKIVLFWIIESYSKTYETGNGHLCSQSSRFVDTAFAHYTFLADDIYPKFLFFVNPLSDQRTKKEKLYCVHYSLARKAVERVFGVLLR